jgi:2-hydroxy-3-oxopropionate reductase
MASNIVAAGYPMIVFTRTMQRAGPLVDAGVSAAANPAEVAANADTVITMLPDSSDVVAVAEGPNGLFAGAHDGLTWIDMSSIIPSTAREIARRAASYGIACLDAPVSGGEQGAIDGTLSIMVGGPDQLFERCVPLLSCMGASIVRIGETGSGQVAKVCNQVVVGCTIGAVAEALVLAVKAGVDPARVREALLGGFAGSKVLEAHGERMLTRTFAPGSRSALHQKDLVNALDTARTHQSVLALTAVVAQLMAAQAAAGEADLDHSALVKVYERLSSQTIA